jgi:DNA-binding HxlR family transcriptional regulator
MSRSNTAVTEQVSDPSDVDELRSSQCAPPAEGQRAAGESAARDAVLDSCPVSEVIDHVAGKWSVGIIVAAATGPIRFTELERAVGGISRRMLTLTLRKLERDGLLHRTVYPTVPPKVEYALTDAARELHGWLLGLTEWAGQHATTIAAARADYDAREA